MEIAEEILSWCDCLWCCKNILLPHPPPITLLPLHVTKDIYKRTSHREQPQISEDSFVSTGNRSRQQLLRHYSHVPKEILYCTQNPGHIRPAKQRQALLMVQLDCNAFTLVASLTKSDQSSIHFVLTCFLLSNLGMGNSQWISRPKFPFLAPLIVYSLTDETGPDNISANLYKPISAYQHRQIRKKKKKKG